MMYCSASQHLLGFQLEADIFTKMLVDRQAGKHGEMSIIVSVKDWQSKHIHVVVI